MQLTAAVYSTTARLASVPSAYCSSPGTIFSGAASGVGDLTAANQRQRCASVEDAAARSPGEIVDWRLRMVFLELSAEVVAVEKKLYQYLLRMSRRGYTRKFRVEDGDECHLLLTVYL